VTDVVVLADTHIRRGSRRRLSDAVVAELERADVILHAGDLLVPEVLEELSGLAPVHAVLGNNDHELVGCLPEHLVVDIDGVRVAMVHDAGARAGRAGRLHRRFSDAALVVFGHSHVPVDELGIEGQRLFNPGSPTERRGQPHHTIGRLRLTHGRVALHEIHVV
jgi:uncharacterized protein